MVFSLFDNGIGFSPEQLETYNSLQPDDSLDIHGFRNVIFRWEQQRTDKTMPMELHVLNIGDIAFASNRFELFMDFQHRIQARSPFEQTFIIQLSSQPDMDRGSYLCTERGFEGRGYSASLFDITVSPKGGQQLVEETVKQLKELYAGE